MLLDKQVTDLESSMVLKGLGVEQQSLFYWERNCNEVKDREYILIFSAMHDMAMNELGDGHSYKDNEHYSAFTASEIMDLLPVCIDIKKEEPFNNFWLHVHKRRAENIQYIAEYICDSISGGELNNPNFPIRLDTLKSHSENLVDCLVKLLIIYLSTYGKKK